MIECWDLEPPKPEGEMRKDHVPANLIAPIVARYIREMEDAIGRPGAVLGASGSAYHARAVRAVGPRGVLATEAGCNERWLRQLLKGETKWIQFRQADKLLCTMELNYLWWQPPLSSWYWHTDITEVEPRLLKRRAQERARRARNPERYASKQREYRRNQERRRNADRSDS